MPNSALTRWLKQGLRLGMCPLCRVAQKLDREYIWYFSDEWSSEEWAIDAFAAARGFCAQHAEQLREVEVIGLASTVGISDLYLETAQRLIRDLEALEDDGWLEQAECPACEHRRQGVDEHAAFLFRALAESPEFRAAYEASPGVCVEHFQMLWDTSQHAEDRTLLREVQLRAISRLAMELGEHLRKQRAEFRHEPPGPELDAWQRAIWWTSGWPPRFKSIDASNGVARRPA